MGKFEDEPFRKGTLGVAEALAASTGVTAIGGGETAEAIEKFGFADQGQPRLDRRRGVPGMPRREILQLAPRDTRSLRGRAAVRGPPPSPPLLPLQIPPQPESESTDGGRHQVSDGRASGQAPRLGCRASGHS